METEIIKLDHIQTKTEPTYGGTTTTVEYLLTTECEGIKNEYVITAQIRGIHTADLHLSLTDCKPLTNNENTLVQEAIEDLLGW